MKSKTLNLVKEIFSILVVICLMIGLLGPLVCIAHSRFNKQNPYL